ncbi:MAG: O-antigen ligase family protein [Luteolibacter sp.]
MPHRAESRLPKPPPMAADPDGSRAVFWVFWTVLTLATYLVAVPWAGFHGVLFALIGLCMACFPPRHGLPRGWWLLATAFGIAALACFLPAGWFGLPAWRQNLQAIGVDTGSLVAIQARQAAEMLAVFGIMLWVGMWLAGHRADGIALRGLALAYTCGVACYAVASRMLQITDAAGQAVHFGFFPNRNHSGTYLAMGAICGLGCVLQAMRDKRFHSLVLALAATATCLWAVAAWSISRGGVVLVATGGVLWLLLLGRRYLGRHGLWAVGLIALTAVGLFFIADTSVKERLAATMERVGAARQAETETTPVGSSDLAANPGLESLQDIDLRIPIHLDTLGLIRDFPWTGIGAGQFYYVFPQYRQRTIVAQGADAFHPEGDWLWLASETGLPAAAALLALVLWAVWHSLRGIRGGRDRALRSACLVAALLVPIHGLFDVPGHRITLAWSAALLFALSLHVPGSSAKPALRWPARVAALLLLAAASVLIRAEWFRGNQPATTVVASATRQLNQLYAEDKKLQQAAEEKGIPYQPDPAEDKLEQALRIIDQTRPAVPLHRDLPRHEAFCASHFDDKTARIKRALAIDLALDPTSVDGPLRQAGSLQAGFPQLAAESIRQALARARAVDAIDPENRFNSAHTRERIRQLLRTHPDIGKYLTEDDWR